MALAIGREWGVGAAAAVGDRARNAGVVVLLVPRETSQDGSGHISIQVGRGPRDSSTMPWRETSAARPRRSSARARTAPRWR